MTAGAAAEREMKTAASSRAERVPLPPATDRFFLHARTTNTRRPNTRLYYYYYILCTAFTAFLLSCIFRFVRFSCAQFIAAGIFQNGVSRLWPCSRCIVSVVPISPYDITHAQSRAHTLRRTTGTRIVYSIVIHFSRDTLINALNVVSYSFCRIGVFVFVAI